MRDWKIFDYVCGPPALIFQLFPATLFLTISHLSLQTLALHCFSSPRGNVSSFPSALDWKLWWGVPLGRQCKRGWIGRVAFKWSRGSDIPSVWQQSNKPCDSLHHHYQTWFFSECSNSCRVYHVSLRICQWSHRAGFQMHVKSCLGVLIGARKCYHTE